MITDAELAEIRSELADRESRDVAIGYEWNLIKKLLERIDLDEKGK